MALAGWLRQSTAVDVAVGPFVDSTDGNTPETALTIDQANVRLSKNGQAFAQKADPTTLTHLENGYYNCELDATDTDTLGVLTLVVHEAGALAVRHDYLVLPANVYDALIGGSDKLEVDATQIEGSDATDQIAASVGASLVNTLWTTQLPESYAADGDVPTPAQALLMILQRLIDVEVTETTMTVRRRDGTTTAYTVALDDADAPTDIGQS